MQMVNLMSPNDSNSLHWLLRIASTADLLPMPSTESEVNFTLPTLYLCKWHAYPGSCHLFFFFFFFFWVTGELSTLRQLMKVPNEPGLSPNNGLENVSLSDQSMASNPRKGQAKCPGAKTTSHDGRAGHVMTHMCHPSKARRMASVTIQVPLQGICTLSIVAASPLHVE